MGILLAIILVALIVQATLKIEARIDEKKRAEKFEKALREFYKQKLEEKK